jgi:hypothetical protein
MSILDEIDSGLDIDALRDVAGAVNGLKRPTNSVLMVTHYKVRECGGEERGEREGVVGPWCEVNCVLLMFDGGLSWRV